MHTCIHTYAHIHTHTLDFSPDRWPVSNIPKPHKNIHIHAHVNINHMTAVADALASKQKQESLPAKTSESPPREAKPAVDTTQDWLDEIEWYEEDKD